MSIFSVRNVCCMRSNFSDKIMVCLVDLSQAKPCCVGTPATTSPKMNQNEWSANIKIILQMDEVWGGEQKRVRKNVWEKNTRQRKFIIIVCIFM